MVQWITSHSEYQLFRNPDRQFRTASFYVPVLCTAGPSAIGITISRKVGKAVQRNLLKRRIKSWLRKNYELLPANIKVNLVAGQSASALSYAELDAELQLLASKLGS